MFANTYYGKRVLVTGHTGFKGSWLTTWLLKLGATVIGVSKDVPTQPAMFNELDLASRITHFEADIRDLAVLQEIIASEEPDYIFHLAAQAVVSTSYANPIETITTNVIGTANILETLRVLQSNCIVVLITSDKCYDNVEWLWGYRETDTLGGKDVYSGSKGSAELIIKSYVHSFFKDGNLIQLAIGRAGNVIGGGDWANDRIVVDCMRAWSDGHSVEIRNPYSTRPWQHVLEPLSGYLLLGQVMTQRDNINGEAFNFGPSAEQNRTVFELLNDLGKHWGFNRPEKAYQINDKHLFKEAGLLKLNCDKARSVLGWECNLDYAETISLVGDWYETFYKKQTDMYGLTIQQIDSYERAGVERKRVWAML